MNPLLKQRWAAACLLSLAAVPALAFAQDQEPPAPEPKPAEPAQPERHYRNQAELVSAVRDLAKAHGDAIAVTKIGTSRDGREILAIRVALKGDVQPDSRPALLVTAGIDGDHLVGTEVAVDLAEKLATQAEEGTDPAKSMLTKYTVYIVPRVNPDGAEHYFDDVKQQWRRNNRPDDQDRDLNIDDDGPNDLNGDGYITVMRVHDPKIADLMLDPDDNRMSLKPDRDKGERPEFTLLVEGIDDDGDDQINEDPVGGVDINRNFPHAYDEHGDGAGPYMMSEPESIALLDFVLERPNIAVALTYGVHDNLCKVPDSKAQLPSSAPRHIDDKDSGIYKIVGEKFKEITGLKSVPGENSGGAFYEWAYAQFGIPSFATPLWTLPESKGDDKGKGKDDAKPQASDGGGEKLTPSRFGDISQETVDELEAMAAAQGMEVTDEMRAQVTTADIEQFAGMMGIKIRRIKKDEDAGGAKPKGGSEANKDEAAWLKYSDDERGGDGFVPWTEVEHPKYGKVEVGGWKPYFKMNPPASEVGAIADKQAEFVLDLLSRMPDVQFGKATVKKLNSGLYDVELVITNEGWLPTGTAMAVRNRQARPYVLRIDVPIEKIITGDRVRKFWAIPGSGGREESRWIIQSEDGSDVDVVLFSEKFGEVRHTITLNATEEVTP